MRKKPTIATVAAEAGVAVSTVSRYLNGHYVSKPVRARLSAIINDLGYSRSWTARNLSLGRRGSIGVVVDSSDDPWFVQLLKGIEKELATRDTSLMLASTELRDKYDPALVFEWIRDHRVDGLIVTKAQRRERAVFQAAVDVHLPVVAVVPDEHVTHVQVLRSNNRAAGELVASHLANLGHRAIGFAGGPKHSIDSKHRLRGLRDGLAQRGIRLSEAHVYSCDSFEVDAGATLAEELLSKPLEITAIVMANDALAFGFMRVALRLGIQMPDQLSIVGFDGLPQGALAYPALTTVSQPMEEMGRVAVQRLIESIDAPGRVETVEFPMELVIRESTARAPSVPVKERFLRPV
jgi:DNA-binding LacI/PurR family transcriptional regulator